MRYEKKETTGARRPGYVNDDGCRRTSLKPLIVGRSCSGPDRQPHYSTKRQGETDNDEVSHIATTTASHRRSRACDDLSLSSPTRYVKLVMSAMTHRADSWKSRLNFVAAEQPTLPKVHEPLLKKHLDEELEPELCMSVWCGQNYVTKVRPVVEEVAPGVGRVACLECGGDLEALSLILPA